MLSEGEESRPRTWPVGRSPTLTQVSLLLRLMREEK